MLNALFSVVQSTRALFLVPPARVTPNRDRPQIRRRTPLDDIRHRGVVTGTSPPNITLFRCIYTLRSTDLETILFMHCDTIEI